MDNTIGGTGGDPKKKTKSQPAKYKQMVAPSDSTKLMVEKADGSIGEWGNPIKPTAAPAAASPQKPQMSDKASGLSNTYYPANSVQRGKSIPTQKRSY